MAIFDRFRSGGQAVLDTNKSRTGISEQDANRIIEEGQILEAEGRLDEAMQRYLEAVRLAPNPARAHLNRGNVLMQKGDLYGALDAFRTAIKHKPDYAGAYYNIGNALLGNGQFNEAAENYGRALEIQPGYAEVHCVLGIALKELRQYDQAEGCFRKALEINPELVEAHLNLGSFLLAQGRYKEAWPEYEARHDPGYSARQSIPPNLDFPRWQGESLTGKSIVVWPEQGFGDEIQFSRYIPMLKTLGAARITLVCKPPLKALLETLSGVDAIILNSESSSLRHHDYWTFPLSLPMHFDTSLETIPAGLPYLNALPERISQWHGRLPVGKLRVGLVWKGNIAPNPHRSLPGLSSLASLWTVPYIDFISLQKGPGEEEAATPPVGQPILDIGSDIRDFADTAAIVAQLDLVICIDSAIAHLVGALNKPCWVLLPAIGVDWRWLHERSDSPWFPDVMRLFRQSRHGDWSETIREVTKSLETWAVEQSIAH